MTGFSGIGAAAIGAPNDAASALSQQFRIFSAPAIFDKNAEATGVFDKTALAAATFDCLLSVSLNIEV